jgi:hypothetical protein
VIGPSAGRLVIVANLALLVLAGNRVQLIFEAVNPGVRVGRAGCAGFNNDSRSADRYKSNDDRRAFSNEKLVKHPVR